MGGIGSLRSRGEHTRLSALAGVPVVWGGAHFWGALDMVVADALGHRRASTLRMALARDLARQLVTRAAPTVGAGSGPPMLQLARGLLLALGEGRVTVEANDGRRRGVAHAPTVATARVEHSGVQAAVPTDGYLAGWLAAGIELGLRRDPNSIGATESRCVACGHTRCEFEFGRTEAVPPRALPTLDTIDGLCLHRPGADEAVIEDLTTRTLNWLESQRADSTGRIQPLGVALVVRPAAWLAEVTSAAIEGIEDEAPAATPALLALLRECAVRAVVGDVGRVIVSDWWEAIAGGLPASPDDAARHALAVARAMGWGRWTLVEFVPGEALTLRVPATPLGGVLRASRGAAEVSRDWFASGVAEGIGRLAFGLPWSPGEDVSLGRVLDRLHDRDELLTEIVSCVTAGGEGTTVTVRQADGA